MVNCIINDLMLIIDLLVAFLSVLFTFYAENIWLIMNATTLNQTDCPEVTVPLSIFFTIGAVSLTVNLLVVVAILCNRNLHTPMYCFICSLAAFNTISSTTKTFENLMLAFADGGHLKKKGFSELKLDDVMDSLLCMSFVGSILSFLAIAVDRYVCKRFFVKKKKKSLLAHIFPHQPTNPQFSSFKDLLRLDNERHFVSFQIKGTTGFSGWREKHEPQWIF